MIHQKQKALVVFVGLTSFTFLTGFAAAPVQPAPSPTATAQPQPSPTLKPSPAPVVTPKPTTTPLPTSGDTSVDRIRQDVLANHPDIPAAAIAQAFSYFVGHASSVGNKHFITIVDFNQPSTVQRMHVIDMASGKVDAYFSAHGKNSGDNYATKFSNVSGSEESSLGIYLTGSEYSGEHGRSMILKGMESTNSNAESRAIVLHGADYVSQDFINSNGRLGRSWGCPAVEMRFHDELVTELKGGSVFLIYHN